MAGDILAELMGLLEKQTELVSQFVANSDESPHTKNIIGSPNSTFGKQGSSTLSSSEKRKLVQVSDIFITEFFKEQKKQQKDTAEKTKVEKLATSFGKKKDKDFKSLIGGKGKAGAEEEEESLLDKILDGIGLGKEVLDLIKKGGIAAAIAKKIFPKGAKPPVGGRAGFFESIANTWKGVVKPFFQSSKAALVTFAENTKNAVKTFGDEAATAFKNFKDEAKPAWEAIVENSKTAFKTFTESAGKAIEYLKTTPISQIFEDVGTALAKRVEDIKGSFKSLTESLAQRVKDLLPGGKAAAETVVEAVADTAQAAKSAGGGALEGIWGGIKGLGQSGLKLGGSLLESGGTAIKSVGSAVGEGIGAIGTISKDSIKNLLKTGVKNAGGAKGIIKGLRGNVVIGGIIESILAGVDIYNKKQEFNEGNLSLEDLQSFSGERVVTALVTTITGAVGGTLGGIMGGLLGPPGVILGSIAGGYLGSKAGEYLGELVNEYIFPPQYHKMIGAVVTGTALPKEEMQDFIFSKGRAYPFSSKDEIIGMKEGGPADKLLSPLGMPSKPGVLEIQTANIQKLNLENYSMNPHMPTGNISNRSKDDSMSKIMDQQGHINKHMKSISDTNHVMIEYLKSIAQNTAIIANGSKQSLATNVAPPIIPTGGPQTGFQKFNTILGDNRGSYSNSVYAL